MDRKENGAHGIRIRSIDFEKISAASYSSDDALRRSRTPPMLGQSYNESNEFLDVKAMVFGASLNPDCTAESTSCLQSPVVGEPLEKSKIRVLNPR